MSVKRDLIGHPSLEKVKNMKICFKTLSIMYVLQSKNSL